MAVEQSDFITTVIVSVLGGGAVVELINWIRHRKKDSATAELSDVQTLQAKLAYVEQVAEYLRKHNDELQKDYEELDQRYRNVRNRVAELEEELDKLSRSASQTQARCEMLSDQVKKLRASLGEVDVEPRSRD